MRFFIRTVASLLGTVALLAALCALGLHFWPGSQRITVAAAAVSPVLLVATVLVALVCFLYLRAVLRLLLVVAVAAAGIWVQSPLWRADGPRVESAITVLNSNIQVGGGDVDALAALVRDKRVDVLAVEELTPEAERRIASSTIARELPHSLVRSAPGADGTGLYSRYPLSSAAEVPGFTLAALSAVATMPGHGQVQLFAVHPVPPLNAQLWDRELRQIGTLLHGVPAGRPVIALGDYNSTYDHVQFRRLLSGGYESATALAGAGWLATYPTDKAYPAMVGIDHVLVRGLGASSVSAHQLDGADHKAVLATVG